MGVEAKRSPKKLQKDGMSKAQALYSYCHEVYGALPYKVYHKLSEVEKRELKSFLQSAKIGLLLVRKGGFPRVIEERPVEPGILRLDFHNQAEELFRIPNKDECELLLKEFLSRFGRGPYDFLKAGAWSCEAKKGKIPSFWHTIDDSDGWRSYGGILFYPYKICAWVRIESEKMFSNILPADESTIGYISEEILTAVGWLDEFEEEPGVVQYPVLVAGTAPESEDPLTPLGISLDLRSINDALNTSRLHNYCVFLRNGGYTITNEVRACIGRRLVISSSKDALIIDELRELYDVVWKIGVLLEEGELGK